MVTFLHPALLTKSPEKNCALQNSYTTFIVFSAWFKGEEPDMSMSSQQSTRVPVAQPGGGGQMGNCPFHLDICPLQFLLVSFYPLKFYFFRIVYLFLN
jgi:hypothetical protein